MVFNGDLPWRRVVKLYGEGGVTLGCGADVAVLLLCQSQSVPLNSKLWRSTVKMDLNM